MPEAHEISTNPETWQPELKRDPGFRVYEFRVCELRVQGSALGFRVL